jgi:hypothetical protein
MESDVEKDRDTNKAEKHQNSLNGLFGLELGVVSDVAGAVRTHCCAKLNWLTAKRTSWIER